MKLFPKTAKDPMARWLRWGLNTFSKPPYGTVLRIEASGLKEGQFRRMAINIAHLDGYLFTANPVVACLLQYLDGSMTSLGYGSRLISSNQTALCAKCSAWVFWFNSRKGAAMKWSRSELNRLSPILEQISSDLAPMDGKKILVLCSATGEVVFWLAELMEQGQVMGLELDSETLEIARCSAHEMGLDQVVIFLPAEETMIPLPASSFDAIVSEFIVYPTTSPTQIGQIEMALVLKPGGKMIRSPM